MAKNIDQVYEKLLPLLARHSPDSLSFSKISRWVGVPRSTLYYYFGNDLQVLILEAVKTGAKSFVQSSFIKNYTDFASYYEFQRHVVEQSYKFVRKYPYAPFLYLRYRSEPGNLGVEVRRIEGTYFQKHAEAWTYFHKTKADPLVLRLMSYLKIGVLYGLETDQDTWFAPKNEAQLKHLMDYMAKVTSNPPKL